MESGIHLSIYETSLDLLNRAKSFLGRKGKLFPTFIYERLMAGIGFLPLEASGRLRIEFSSGTSNVQEIQNPSVKRDARKLFRRSRYDLFKRGMWPILSAIQVPNVGASYHIGTLQSETRENLINENGRLLATANLYVVDSAALQRIPVGPITVAAMINAIRIVEESLTDE
jgi:hypothetical protein